MARYTKEKTKKIIIRELKKGKTPKELAKRFRSFSMYQIRAFKAHITMGRY